MRGRALTTHGFTRLAAAALPVLAGVAFAAPACAGPPYVTDDPQPTDTGHWEIYNFGSGSHVPGETAGEAGLDLNYGGAKDLQLTAVIPAEFDGPRGQNWGMGDLELAAKYRFAHQDGPLGLDIAVFPRVFLPTASSRGPGDHHASLLLPLWAERDFGPWSVFGGGGYTFNPGRDNRSFWTSGLAVTRSFGERLSLGAEIYHEGPDVRDARAFTGVNFGATYKLTRHWSLLGSLGPGVQNAREQGQSAFYAALKADF